MLGLLFMSLPVLPLGMLPLKLLLQMLIQLRLQLIIFILTFQLIMDIIRELGLGILVLLVRLGIMMLGMILKFRFLIEYKEED